MAKTIEERADNMIEMLAQAEKVMRSFLATLDKLREERKKEGA